MARATAERKPELRMDGEPVDLRGPTEARKRLAGRYSEIGGDRQVGLKYTLSDSPLCRMFKDKRLSGIQFTALSKFHSHWWNAGLSESIRGIDLNRIYAPDPFSSAGMSRSDRQYQNRREWRSAYALLAHTEGILVTNLICSESLNLEQCGNMLGYISPFRARAAATKVVCSVADRWAKFWGIG